MSFSPQTFARWMIKIRRQTLEDLKKQTDFFHAEGFEVGVWTLTLNGLRGEHHFTDMIAVSQDECILKGPAVLRMKTFRNSSLIIWQSWQDAVSI